MRKLLGDAWSAVQSAAAAGFEPDEALAQRLSRLRLAAGLSESRAAALAGVGIGTLRAIEAGRTTNPHVLTLLPLSRLYGLSVERLMEGLA